MVEHDLAKVGVAGSSPVFRSFFCCPGGGIGRRAGLKIQWPFRLCGFKSRSGYKYSDESNVTFYKKAHSFPQSLGGDSICENVCDSCNGFFGSPQSYAPAIKVVLKEILNISKYLLLKQINMIPKNKRFKSEYFNLNWDKKTILLKPRYSIRKGFQEKLGRLFKSGIYKVFLEEKSNR